MTDDRRPDDPGTAGPGEDDAAEPEAQPEVESSADEAPTAEAAEEPTPEESADDEPAEEPPAEEPTPQESPAEKPAPLTVIRSRRRRDRLAPALIGVFTLLLGF